MRASHEVHDLLKEAINIYTKLKDVLVYIEVQWSLYHLINYSELIKCRMLFILEVNKEQL
jgi:hypothetical protein